MDEDKIADTLNVGDKVECVRDSPDNNDSIAIGMQGVICVIVESSPHIGVRWNEEVVGGHDCNQKVVPSSAWEFRYPYCRVKVLALCGYAGIGRQASLRCLCPSGRVSSNLTTRTTEPF